MFVGGSSYGDVCCPTVLVLFTGITDRFDYIRILQVLLPYDEEETPRKWMFQQTMTPNTKSWFQTNSIQLVGVAGTFLGP